MKYICSDCGHKANSSSKGVCPACSSGRFTRNLANGKVKSTDSSEESKKSKSIIDNRLVLIAVWVVFAYAIYDLVKNN